MSTLDLLVERTGVFAQMLKFWFAERFDYMHSRLVTMLLHTLWQLRRQWQLIPEMAATLMRVQ
jgi:hypothetical protein